MILQGDALEQMHTLSDNSVDAVITDPPYGYSFMGKSWDKAVPSVEIWQECLRVLKPGAFACVMSAPRSDVQNAMISRLMEAGFRLDFTPIYWTYASGFPKAMNIGKAAEGKVLTGSGNKQAFQKLEGEKAARGNWGISKMSKDHGFRPTDYSADTSKERTLKVDFQTEEGAALDGSYAGFQPKPAVEVIIVAMKPLSEKTYIDQALKNGKGITWLDDCRVPYTDEADKEKNTTGIARYKSVIGSTVNGSTHFLGGDFKIDPNTSGARETGRFPANLLVQDDVLNDGTTTKSTKSDYNWTPSDNQNTPTKVLQSTIKSGVHYGDSGSYSRYFDLDKWAAAHLTEQQMSTFPFAIFPKASKSEKNKGLTGRDTVTVSDGRKKAIDNPFQRGKTERVNSHPTVKPLKLMSYLITLFSREGDTVLDPFMGSGTTGVACKNTGRNFIGIELDEEYFEIAKERIMSYDQL